MKKVLFTATVDSHILNFHIPYLKWFREKGYEVHVASNGSANIPYSDKKYDIAFERSPFKITNIRVYKALKKIIDENQYEVIHCHTPMGSVLTRLAARKARKHGTKVIYTAHGFHFYQGSPLINWALYYPVEKWLSKYTDCLITLNSEDYQRACAKFDHHCSNKYVDGVGVDVSKFVPQTLSVKAELRKSFGYSSEEFILLYTGEMSYRKHQDLLLKVVHLLKNQIPNIKLLLAGTGSLLEHYQELSRKLEIESYVVFLGYRNDVDKLLQISDIAVSSSRQEGLPVNIIEAMATALPLVVTDSRGNRDLVVDGQNGFIAGINDVDGFAEAVAKIYKSKELRVTFSKKNEELVDKYALKRVINHMGDIYSEYIER